MRLSVAATLPFLRYNADSSLPSMIVNRQASAKSRLPLQGSMLAKLLLQQVDPIAHGADHMGETSIIIGPSRLEAAADREAEGVGHAVEVGPPQLRVGE